MNSAELENKRTELLSKALSFLQWMGDDPVKMMIACAAADSYRRDMQNAERLEPDGTLERFEKGVKAVSVLAQFDQPVDLRSKK